MKKEQKVYDPVIPDLERWPIYQLSEDRKRFVEEINEFTVNRLLKLHKKDLADLIAKTIYLERIRMKEERWKVDPPNERQFWRKISNNLVKHSLDREEEEAAASNEAMLRKIVNRYSEEIVGTFRIPTFKFARKFAALLFRRLLNTAAGRNLSRIWGDKYKLEDRLLVKGEVDKLRKLMTKGTVVVVPTHFSNLDSLIIGYTLYAIAGLPFFSFGAGLNLYNTGYTAYFMNRLGTYRIDRRKKNPIYLETLKAMSNLSIQRGTNNLFFPGGTRSRSGRLETKLKLGMLGTVVDAQRALYQRGEEEKIFVVPLVLSYHFVLEAKFLIEQHLKREGKERYLKTRDQSYSRRKLFKFVWQLFSESNEIIVSVGQPMDVMGNPVDEDGISHDKFGKPIDVKDYFVTDGVVKEDWQRESEYTRMLGTKIVDRYFKDNIVLSSHLVAFAAFELLKKENAKLDLFGILRLPVEDYAFKMETLLDLVEQIQSNLIEMAAAGQVKLSDAISLEPEALIKDGLRHLGTYHVRKPLRYIKKRDEIISESFQLLYFYHGRLEHYGLEEKIKWKVSQPELIA